MVEERARGSALSGTVALKRAILCISARLGQITRNGNNYLQDYIASRPRRQSSASRLLVRAEGLTAALMNGSILWDITPCNTLKVNRRSSGSKHKPLKNQV
jgi:hypothetical protein